MHLSSPATHDTVTHPQPHPLPRLDIKQHILLSIFWFSLNFQSAALLPLIIPLQVVLILAPGVVGNTQQAVILGWIAGVGSAIALVVMPLTGMLSDYTRTRFGRRRPYILFGTLVMVGATLALGYTRTAIGFLVALGIMHLSSVVTNAAYQGLLPDLVPDSQRGAASGYMGLMTILGNVGSLAVAGLLLIQVNSSVAPGPAFHGIQLFYLLASIILFAGMFVTVVGIREAHLPHRGTRTPGKWYQRWATLWLVPLRQRNFVWVFLTRAAVMLGLTLFMTFIEYYFADVVQTPNFVQATAAVALMALVGAVGSAIVLGFVSDRVGRVPVVFFASACMALTALMFVIMRGNFPLWPLGIIFGLGYGAYTSVDWALAIDVLPSQQHAGQHLGLWSLAATIPAIVAPLLGSGVIAAVGNASLATGYRAVFALATLFLILGAVCIWFVEEPHRQRRHPKGEPHA